MIQNGFKDLLVGRGGVSVAVVTGTRGGYDVVDHFHLVIRLWKESEGVRWLLLLGENGEAGHLLIVLINNAVTVVGGVEGDEGVQ